MALEHFIETPNFPLNPVTLAVVSGAFPQLHTALNKLGIQTIPTEPSRFLSPPVAQHADLQCMHLGGNTVVVAKTEVPLADALQSQGLHILPTERPLGPKYPEDVLLNAVQAKSILMGKLKTLDPVVLKHYQNKNWKISNVRQGYTNCSVAMVSEQALITADTGIAAVAQTLGLRVLTIRPGFIALPGLNYGFIGGCCGLIAKDTLAFTGKLNYHPDYEKMIQFITSEGKQILELTQGQLIDVGGIIPLKESALEKVYNEQAGVDN